MDKRLKSLLWAVALSLTAVFSAMGCLVSGFGLDPIGFWTALSWCLTAVVFSLFYGYRFSLTAKAGMMPAASTDLSGFSRPALLCLGGLAVLGVFLWLQGSLSSSVELLLQSISEVWDRAYGWGVISWSDGSLDEVGIGPALCWLGLPIVIVTCHAVLRRRHTWLTVLMALLPLGCCMVVTDTVPGVLPLFLLLLTALLLMITHTVRRRDEVQGNRLLAILTVPVAAGLLLLFLLVPQEGYDRQAGAQRIEDAVVSWLQGDFAIVDIPQPTRPEATENTSPIVNPGLSLKQENLLSVGPKTQSDMRIMTVTAEQSCFLYLRGAGYVEYTGTSWAAAEERDPYWPDDSQLGEGGSVEISTMIAHDVLYLPYYTNAEDYESMAGGRLPNIDRNRLYRFSRGVLPVQELVTDVGSQYGDDMAAYLQLPEETALWAAGVIEELFGTDTPPLTAETVYAISEYVRSSAQYDLNTSRMAADYGDFARWFLTESDTGYCIHFASATAVLLRAAGIPSRYVTGYAIQTNAGQSVTVTGKHAHAWVEFRLPDKPWYILESTPQYEEEEAPKPTLPEITAPTRPQETTETTVPVEEAPPVEEERTEVPPAVWWLLAGIGVCAAVLIQWRLRVALRRGRETKGRSKQRALARWQRHAMLAKLLKQPPDRELLELAQKARFSQHTISQEELAAFSKGIREQIRQLKKKSVWLRLYGTVILALY